MTGARRTAICCAALTFAVLWAAELQGYDRYKNPVTEAGNCSACHGDFTDSTSPQGTVFPFGDKHEMHRSSSAMNADCDLCHTSGDGRNPFIGSSDGTATNAGYGCAGCHGREGDEGFDGISPGRGAGLRQHHTNAGVNDCMSCHTDADPASYTPVAESSFPTYYGDAIDSNVNEPCNAVAMADMNENWSVGDFVGLDNDGDMLYDLVDPDCGSGGPDLTIGGVCPGPIDLDVSGATPNASLAIVFSATMGSFTVPTGNCAGTMLDLSAPSLLTITAADGAGNLSLSPTAPASACGLFLQVLDLTSCQPTNVDQVPI